MLDHHIQRSIVYTLAFADSLRFSDLQPDDIENKLFNYHLKKVIAAGFVAKNTDGSYSLTATGKRIGKGALESSHRLIDRAYSILFLAIRRPSDGAWLIYTRRSQPLIGMSGFMQAQPVASETIIETAVATCREATGISTTFRVIGSGFFRMHRNDILESFTHFTLLGADVETDTQLTSADLSWVINPTNTLDSPLQTLHTLIDMYEGKTDSFVDLTIAV